MNLRWYTRKGSISGDFAKQKIARLRTEKREEARRSSYNPISRIYQATLDLINRFYQR